MPSNLCDLVVYHFVIERTLSHVTLKNVLNAVLNLVIDMRVINKIFELYSNQKLYGALLKLPLKVT